MVENNRYCIVTGPKEPEYDGFGGEPFVICHTQDSVIVIANSHSSAKWKAFKEMGWSDGKYGDYGHPLSNISAILHDEEKHGPIESWGVKVL